MIPSEPNPIGIPRQDQFGGAALKAACILAGVMFVFWIAMGVWVFK